FTWAMCSNPLRAKLRFGAVEILFMLGGLLVALVVAGFSCTKSYFEKGRLRGMEEATREIARGVSSHYETEGQVVPEKVAKAIKAVRTVSGKRFKVRA